MSEREFSVYQYFEDGSYELLRQFVDAQTAVKVAYQYTHNPAAILGITRRVIITDGGDSITFEWKHHEGVVYPPPNAA